MTIAVPSLSPSESSLADASYVRDAWDTSVTVNCSRRALVDSSMTQDPSASVVQVPTPPRRRSPSTDAPSTGAPVSSLTETVTTASHEPPCANPTASRSDTWRVPSSPDPVATVTSWVTELIAPASSVTVSVTG
jgi:hypothetical protein